jgi:enterochelin esterase-like enzyme
MVWSLHEAVIWRVGTPLTDSTSVVFLAWSPSPLFVTGMMNGWKAQPMKRLEGTDLQYLRFEVPHDSRIEYVLTSGRGNAMPDPLNKNAGLTAGAGRSICIMPGYTPPFTLRKKDDVPTGRIDTLTINSKNLGYNREILVYVPSGEFSDEAGLLITGDGYGALIGAKLNVQLDNLIASGEIEPVVAAMIRSDPHRRAWEYGANREYRTFLATELIPQLRETYGVSSDPGRVAIMGVSLGALMAADPVQATAATARSHSLGITSV